MWRSTKLPFLFCSVLFSLLIVSINFSASFSVPYSPLSCPSNQFSCGDYCIPLNWRCDQSDDCNDKSDEKDCPLANECDIIDFQCDNGKCITPNLTCDGKDDCGDLSDEINCTCDQFTCANGNCIPHGWKCDGINDCLDLSDEKNC